MPRIQSAIKRVRTSKKKWLHNLAYKTSIKTLVKKVLEKIESKDLEGAQVAKNNAFSLIDKATCKGIIHRNNAARKKSRIIKWLKNLEPKSKTTKIKSRS